MRSIMQHLAAGVVFAAVALELIPDLMKRRSPVSTAIGFVVAVVILVVLNRSEDKSSASSGPAVPKSYIACVGVDLFLDGLIIAIAANAGAKQGKLLTLALTLELASLGLALVGELLKRKMSRLRAFLITRAVSSLLIAGAVLSALVLNRMSPTVLTAALGFGVAALLFLITEELLREAHEQEDTTLATAIFFVGFLELVS